jgi:poly-gamma-glutamate synthesis protein (capsule biosynthesis protein)
MPTSPAMPVVSRRILAAAVLLWTFALPAQPMPAPAEFRLLLAGQALVKHDLRAELPEQIPGIRALLQVDAPHIVFTNLETAIQGSFGGANTRNTEFFHATGPAVVDGLKEFGFNLFATGNNHSWDLGTAGILSTLETLDQRGLVHAGSGRNLGEAAAPAFLNTPAGRVALVAFASGKVRTGGAAQAMRPGVNEVRLDAEKRLFEDDVARVIAAIKLAREFAPQVIVYQHDHYWEEDRGLTPDWKKTFARACLDAGGTVFISHGVPQLHGLEIYRGRPIFYGLGSFIFHTITAPGFYKPEVWQSVLADLVFRDGQLTALRIRPVLLNEMGQTGPRFNATRGAPRAATGADARRVLTEFATLSKGYGTAFHLGDGFATVDLSTTPSPTPNSP